MLEYGKNIFYAFFIWISIAGTIFGMAYNDHSENFELSERALEEKLCILHEQASTAYKSPHITDSCHVFAALDKNTKVTYFSPQSEEESNALAKDICSRHHKIWWYVTPQTQKFNLKQHLEELGLKPYALPAMVCALIRMDFQLPDDKSIIIQRMYETNQEWQTIQSTESNPDIHTIVHYKLLHNNVLTSKGSLLFHDNWVGIFNVATEKEKQRKGFATMLMNYLLHSAQQRGAQCAILESSPEAYDLYKKVGFKELFTTYIYYRP